MFSWWPPDFVLWMDPSGRVLPIRTGPVPPVGPPGDAVAVVTSDFQTFSPFAAPAEEAELPVGGATELGSFLPASGAPQPGTNGGPCGPFYGPESQDGSTLSSPPSDGPAPPEARGPTGAPEAQGPAGAQGPTGTPEAQGPTGAPEAQGPAGAPAPGSLFQFSIGKILEDEGGPREELYEGGTYPQEPDGGPPSPRSPDRAAGDAPPTDQRQTRRVVVSVNDKWHYCHNSAVLVGSRAMRDRHLRLLGYVILQLPFHELEALSGVEEVKRYLALKLRALPP
ncbi:Fas-activated serine/threonine kinase [Liparis tanakae]|uniref:Fas-activated serine/threonine kinase n=1 Tax=Liparis tanakae TaxID=230148 RepID=A0A4Z2E7V6_9TELE|nr:Fas-activated serine/threonine kinase [Liparis tanakae]